MSEGGTLDVLVGNDFSVTCTLLDEVMKTGLTLLLIVVKLKSVYELPDILKAGLTKL